MESEPRLLQPPEGADPVLGILGARQLEGRTERLEGTRPGPALGASGRLFPSALPELACAPTSSLVAGFLIPRMFNLCSKHLMCWLGQKVHLGFSVASYGGICTNVWVSLVDSPGRRGLRGGTAGNQGRLAASPHPAPCSEPGPSSLLWAPHWLPGGLRLEGRLPTQTGLETDGPVPVLDGAVLLGLAEGRPLSGENPLALVPSPSSRWARGDHGESGALSQAPPWAGRTSSGGSAGCPGWPRCGRWSAGAGGVGLADGVMGVFARAAQSCSASHRVFLENAIPERLECAEFLFSHKTLKYCLLYLLLGDHAYSCIKHCGNL